MHAHIYHSLWPFPGLTVRDLPLSHSLPLLQPVQMKDDLLASVALSVQLRVFKMHKLPQKHSPRDVVPHLRNQSGSLEKPRCPGTCSVLLSAHFLC